MCSRDQDIGKGDEHRREIKFCTAYKLALSMLLRIKQLQRLEGHQPSTSSSTFSVKQQESDQASLLALLSRNLTEVKLDPRHTIIILNLVISIQLDIGNYYYAASLIQRLLNLLDEEVASNERGKDEAEREKASLLEKLHICKQNGVDRVPIIYKCVSCGYNHAGKVPSAHCDKCHAPIRFCHTVHTSCWLCSTLPSLLIR